MKYMDYNLEALLFMLVDGHKERQVLTETLLTKDVYHKQQTVEVNTIGLLLIFVDLS